MDRHLVGPRARKRVTPPPPLVPHLASIQVDKLFGKYSYPSIKVFGGDEISPNISFIYGENGAGKTTILRLLYSLMSPEINSGHRGYLSRVKFRNFSLTFGDGQQICAQRSNVDESNYSIIFEGPRINDRFDLAATADGRVRKSDNPSVDRLHQHLASISPTIVFVNDHRTIRSTHGPWDVKGFLNEHFLNQSRHISLYYESAARVDEPDVDTIASVGLERLLQQSHNLLIEKAIVGNAIANAGTGQIYLTIAKTVARSTDKFGKTNDTEIDSLLNKIQVLQSDLNKAEEFGLSQGEYLADIGKILLSARDTFRYQLYEIIEPYVASVEKRVESNKMLVEQMSAFSKGVNAFLKRKQMVCRMDGPIKFLDDDGSVISSADLSSGERHLLYLCCTAMLSRSRQSLIIVDEPELSLNYKWQRQLIDSLLSIAGDSAQFVMATHSFEIISRFRDAALELEPIV